MRSARYRASTSESPDPVFGVKQSPVMIDAAIGEITQQLNQHLRRTLKLGDDMVVQTSPLQSDGSLAPGADNRLLAFLVSVEQEAAAHREAPRRSAGADLAVRSPAVHVSLLLMFAAHFKDYRESLKFVSHTIGFFQARPVLDRGNAPAMDRRFDKLALNIETLKLADLSHLWGMLGGRYLPSVLYRVRLVCFDTDWLKGELPEVRQTEVAAHG